MLTTHINQSILCFFFLFSYAHVQAQTWDGIYSDGEVSLILEESTETVEGLFYDVDETEYEVVLAFDEEGLLGYLGEFYAFIPYDTEVLTLYIIPLDADEEPLWDEANEYELAFVEELYGAEDSEEEYYNYTWKPIRRFGTDFYPSYVLATSTMTNEISYEPEGTEYSFYGDANGYFGISISDLPAGTEVGIVIEGEPFVKSSQYTVRITQDGVSEIYPIIEYDFNALKNITQAQPVNLKYDLYIDGEYFDSKIEVVWVRSVNDAITWAQDHHDNVFSFDFIFAAYVNENEPSLDPILGQILEEGIIDSWSGYQVEQEEVIRQVFALWYHFQKKGFSYSSITTQSGSDDRSSGQTVRFIQDALVSSQANCIDGTVLFASFLYKIGLDVSIVLVPGHAYLAFGIDEQGTGKYALETTMMGSLDLKHANSQDQLYATMNNQDDEILESWNSFLGAINQGTENYITDALPAIQQENPAYLEINIREARQQKIRPIK